MGFARIEVDERAGCGLRGSRRSPRGCSFVRLLFFARTRLTFLFRPKIFVGQKRDFN